MLQIFVQETKYNTIVDYLYVYVYVSLTQSNSV